MTDINSVTIIGRLTKDITINYTQQGSAIGRISIAVNRSFKRNGEYVEESDFFEVNVYGKTAENLRPYLTKGKRVGIEGSLKQNRWQKDGQKFSRVEINATTIELLSSNKSFQNNQYDTPNYYGA